MGKKDTKTKEYLADNKRFADLSNYVLYNGESVIQAVDLQERDTAEVLSILGVDKKEIQEQKWRDLLKHAVIKATDKAVYVLIGVENQSEIHYAMPVRNMIYDALNYGNQVKEVARIHKKNKDMQDSAEFLSGFGKKDRLTPVISITMYWGVDEWDAPKSLHEMFGEMDETIRSFIPDYRINLVAPVLIDDFAKFKTELGPVLEELKYSKDKNKFNHLIATNKKFKALDNESVSVINLFAGAEIPLNANFPGSVILNRVFGFTKLGFPYKINVFRTFLLKMCGFFAILIE